MTYKNKSHWFILKLKPNETLRYKIQLIKKMYYTVLRKEGVIINAN